jgi:hypothetical protein
VVESLVGAVYQRNAVPWTGIEVGGTIYYVAVDRERLLSLVLEANPFSCVYWGQTTEKGCSEEEKLECFDGTGDNDTVRRSVRYSFTGAGLEERELLGHASEQ